jgi:hypothetical protein
MSAKKKTVIAALCLIVVFTGSLIFIYLTDFGIGVRYFLREGKKTKERHTHLLCDTDYQVLLEGCRELSRMVTTGELKKCEYMVRNNPEAETLGFPRVILDLEPTYVHIDSEGRVIVELGGGLHHFGVYGYPVDYKKPLTNFKYGNRKLVDGLWYYEDDYEGNPQLQKKIETLIQKGKQVHGS